MLKLADNVLLDAVEASSLELGDDGDVTARLLKNLNISPEVLVEHKKACLESPEKRARPDVMLTAYDETVVLQHQRELAGSLSSRVVLAAEEVMLEKNVQVRAACPQLNDHINSRPFRIPSYRPQENDAMISALQEAAIQRSANSTSDDEVL